MILDIRSVADAGKEFFDVFLVFWAILDAMFAWIEQQFINVFHAIPVDAIPFLMGIVLMSAIEFIAFLINRMDTSTKRVTLKIFYALLGILLFLISLWRLGVVSMVEKNADFTVTLTKLIVFAVYIIFIVAVIVSFWKQYGTEIRKGIIVILWCLFLLVTWVIAPVFQSFTLSFDTATQTIFSVLFFVIPQGLTKYQEWAKKGV
ncbi:MAG: hypothetical protein R6U96_18725 [Promethearchaeia archaeon]